MSREADLADVLADLGVEVQRVSNDEIQCRCPVHYQVKGRESTRYSFYMNADTGLWLCMSCGARGNLPQLVSELTDDAGALWYVQSTLITKGLRRLTREEAEYDEDVTETATWQDYARFTDLPPAILRNRKVDQEVARRYGVRWSDEDKAMTLPIVSPLGELRGWQYKKTGAVWNYPTGIAMHNTAFGIERAFADTLLVVESPIDAVRFHSLYEAKDISCVGSFGAPLNNAQLDLFASKFQKLIVCLDNDQAGRMAERKIQKRYPRPREYFREGIWFWDWSQTPDAKDFGDMTDAQIIRGISGATLQSNER